MTKPVGATAKAALTSLLTTCGTLLALTAFSPVAAPAFPFSPHSFLGQLSTVATIGSTVPENGDENPLWNRERAREHRLAGARRHPHQQLQQL